MFKTKTKKERLRHFLNMAQRKKRKRIESDLGITHTCHEFTDFHIVHVTYRRFFKTNRVISPSKTGKH